jgi:acyl dehydratase
MINNPDNLPDFMVPGWEAELGEYRFTPQAITEFARMYDPQPFHLDEETAKNTLLGGLCASGWHTASMWMRKQRDYMSAAIAERKKAGLPLPEFGPSPGFVNLKWPRPVMANDTITYFNSTLICRPSNSRPGWHVLSGRQSAKNQLDQPVLSFESTVLVKYPS